MKRRVWAVGKPELRNAGEGLDEQGKRTFAGFMGWSGAMFFALALSLGLILSPVLGALRIVIACAGLVFAVFALAVPMRSADGKMDRLIAGLRGERYVGNALKQLERQGARVVHDVRGPIGNIDHVLIHTSGIYAIETKHRSRPAGRWMEMRYDGQTIRVNGQPLTHDPLPQARRQASWLWDYYTRTLGLTLRHPVKAVVLFPGWQVESTGTGGPVQVLSVGGFLSAVRNCPDRHLSDKQVGYFHDLLVRAQRPPEAA